MRAANPRYKYCKASKASCSKNKSKFSFKFLSVITAVIITVAGLVIPITTLAPAGASEDVKVIEKLSQQPTAINVNCDVKETEPTTVQPVSVQPTTVEETQPVTQAEAESSDVLSEEISESETDEQELSPQNDNGDYSGSYLLSIDNPDSSYSPKWISLSSYDRAKLERLVMGEAGSNGYNGCALAAQAIRDAMNYSHTSSIDFIISEYSYYAPTNREPNQNVKDAVSYIFDQNGSAVQHRILYFNNGKSDWHETQDFVVAWNNERFFDMAD